MKKFLLLALMLLTWSLSGFAQSLADYIMTTGTDATQWQTLSNPTTILELGTSTSGDGKASAVTNIGFTFNFGGTDYTQFSVNSDGNLRFGATVTGTANYSTPFSATNANINNPKINMLGCDGYITDSGYVYHEVIGNAPDRICVIEFATSTYNSTSRPSLLRWQVQLFETTNEIQIVYPSSMPPILPNVARQPGMCVDNSNIILIDASHGAAFYSAGQSTNQVPIGTWPDVDRYYHFTISNCLSVSNLQASNITINSADLSWIAPSGAYSFILEYKPRNGSWATDATAVYPTSNSYSLTGLTPNTYYDVRVANDCGNEQSGFISTTIHTECDIISVTNTPYIEGFEGYTTYDFPNCWTRISGYTSGTTNYPYVSNSTSSHTGGGYFYIYNNTANPVVAALPQFQEDINTLRMEFWMKPVGSTDAYGRLEVGVMSDITNPSTFTLVKSWTAQAIGNTNWQKYVVDFDTVTPSYTADQIVIRRYVTGTSTYGWYIDDIKVLPLPSCHEPTQLAVTNASTNSVELYWNPNDESTFTVYYRPVGDTVYQSVSNVSQNADSTYTLSNLNPSTSYVWYVASVCSDGSESPSDPSTFATTMVPEALPYTTDFGASSDQGWLLNNGSCPNYWTMGALTDTNMNALFITNDGTTPGYAVGSISMVSASKLFTVGDDVQFLISFDVKLGGESSYDYIKLFFAPPTETYPASTVAPTSSDYGYNTYSQYAFNFSDYASYSTYTSFSSYPHRFNLTNGQYVHIDAIMSNPNVNPDANSTAQVVFAWRNDGSGGTQPGAIISNVTVAPVTCPSPENLTVSNLTATSTDISWDAHNSANSWTVEYGETGFAPGAGTTVTVTGNPTTSLSNLTPSTSYVVYVTANCGDGPSITAHTTFKTPCQALTTLPFTENFDSIPGTTATSMAVTNLPDCWTNCNSGTSTSYSGYPIVYESSTYAQSGSNSMRFYTYTTQGTYDDQIAVLPAFDPTLYPVNTLQFSFDARALSTSYPFVLVVGVMSNPSDKTSFVALDTITLTSTTYSSFEFPLATYTGNGNFIALKAPQPTANYNYGYVDNIVVDVIPSCPKPIHFAASAVGSNSVELNWTEVGSATQWEIEYGPAGFTPGGTTGTVEPVYSNPPYTIPALTSNTAYDFYIRANCVSEYSVYSPVLSITTACDAIDSLPYTDSFDTYGTGTTVYPACWGKINTYSSDRPYVNSSSPYDGVGSLYFYAGTSNTYNIAITPPFDASIPVNTLQATFMYKASSASDRLIVGVMSNPSDASTFVPMDTILPASTASQWVEREVIFASYTGTGQYIAFKNAYTTTGAYAYIDHLVIDLIPSCPKPTQIHAVSATVNSIELGWTENGPATSWTIEYGPAGFTQGTGDIEYASSNPFTITNLSASSVYDFYITADCGSEYSQATLFSTATACGAISSLPYRNGFDTYGTGTTVYPTCWGKINTYSSDRPYVNSTHYSGVGSLYFYASSTTYNIAVVPEFDSSIPVNTLQASFMYRATNSTDRLIVGVMTNPTVASTFQPVDTVYPGSPVTGWIPVEVNFNNYTGTGQYIAFYNGNPSASYCYSYIDDLFIGVIPTCPRPSNLHVVSSTNSSIELGWTENGTATSWQIVYGPTGFNPEDPNANTETVYTNPTTISNLTAATHYDFYVIADCGGETSYLSNVLTTATECDAITTLPFHDGFDSYGTGTTVYPLCWGKNSTYADRPYVNSTHYSGVGSLYFYASSTTYNIAIAPQFDATIPVNTLQASFMYRATNSTDRLIVGVMTNPNDATTFQAVDTVYPGSPVSTWIPVEVNFTNYTGTGQYIAFYNGNPSAACYAYIDTLVIDLASTCPRPTHLTITNTTSSSMTLSWTAGGGETSWEIAYGAVGFDPEDPTESTIVTATTNPFTVSNLNSATSYEFYVRALCSATDQSSWSMQSASGTTECAGTVALPYTENFDSYVGTTYSDNNGIAPACWTTQSNNATYGAPHITSSGSYHYANSAPNCMVFTCSSAGADAYAALPTFSANLNTLKLNFWRAMESTSQGTLTVGYVTNLNDMPNTFVAVATIPSVSSSAGDTISVDFTDATIPANGNICFNWHQASTFYSCCIDDITVTSSGSGPVVTDPTVATNPASGITQTSATLNATITNPSSVTISSKGFEWKVNGGQYATVTGTGTGDNFSATLPNLAPNTTYTFKAFIVYNGTTISGSELQFTTAQGSACNAPTDLTVYITTSNSVTLDWAQVGTPDSWTVSYKQSSAETWTTVNTTTHPYTLTNLGTNTEYEAFVVANCGSQESGESNHITFTPTGVNDYVMGSTSLYPNPTTGKFRIENSELRIENVEVYDVYGKLILNVKVGDNYAELDLSGNASGVYFTRIMTEKGMVTKRIVKK